MIQYKQQSWLDVFHIFLAWKGSLYKSVWIQVLILTAWGALVANVADAETVETGLGFPSQAHIIAASAFGFLLVYKSQISYDRFWFGRSVFGALMANIRDFALMYVNFIDPKKEDAARARANAVRYIGGFLALVTQTLHNDADPTASFAEDMDYSFLKDWFTESECTQLEEYKGCKVALVSGWILSLTEQLRREGYIVHASQFRLLESKVHMILQNWARLSTIWSTPIPFPYTQMLQVAMIFYVFTMPFVFIPIMGGNLKRRWGVPAAMVIFGSLYYGLKSTAEELEDPFGDDDNDLPIDALAAGVDKDLRAFLTDPRVLRGTSTLAAQLPARNKMPDLKSVAPKKTDVHFFGSVQKKKGFATHRTIDFLKRQVLDEMEAGPTLVCKVWDEDNITAHDFIGLFKVPFSRFSEGERIEEWFPLMDEKGKPQPGIVHASLLYAHSLVRAAPEEQTARSAVHKGMLVVHIIEAKELPVMDLNGKSDPFVTVQFGSTMKRTKTIRKSLNPIWNESLTFEFHEAAHLDAAGVAHGHQDEYEAEHDQDHEPEHVDIAYSMPDSRADSSLQDVSVALSQAKAKLEQAKKSSNKSWRENSARVVPVNLGTEPQDSTSTSMGSNRAGKTDADAPASRAVVEPSVPVLAAEEESSRSTATSLNGKANGTQSPGGWDKVPVQQADEDGDMGGNELSSQRPEIIESVTRQRGGRVPFIPPPPRVPSITASPRLDPPSPPAVDPLSMLSKGVGLSQSRSM